MTDKVTDSNTEGISGSPDTPPTPKPAPSARLKATAAVLVIIALAVIGYQLYHAYFLVEFDPSIVRHDGDTLYIVAFGNVAPDAMDIARKNIERVYPELGRMKTITMEIPPDARVIIEGTNIKPVSGTDWLLKFMDANSALTPGLLKAMAVVEEPLYCEEGGAEYDIWGFTDAVGGNYGVVSTTLKRIEIENEGTKPGTRDYAFLFDLSLGKSVLHEFGHLMGLNHCRGSMGRPMEVLSPNSALVEHGNVLCGKHCSQLRELYESWGTEPMNNSALSLPLFFTPHALPASESPPRKACL